MKRRRQLVLGLLSVPILFLAVGAVLLEGRASVQVRNLQPKAVNAYRLIFEVPNIRFQNRAKQLAPMLTRSDAVTEEYWFVPADGNKRPPRNAEAYAYPTLTGTKEIHVLKPRSGTWGFQVKQRTERSLLTPLMNIRLADREVIWRTDFFTNQFRPPDIHSLSEDSPFD